MKTIAIVGLGLMMAACGGAPEGTGRTGATIQSTGVTCAVASGDYVGCDGPAHPYAIGFWAIQESPSAPAVTDAGLVQWSCWEAQTTPTPSQHVCPSGNACDVWRAGTDGGVVHELGTCL